MGEQRCRAARSRAYAVGHFDIYVGEQFEHAVALQTAFLQRHLARRWPAARRP